MVAPSSTVTDDRCGGAPVVGYVLVLGFTVVVALGMAVLVVGTWSQPTPVHEVEWELWVDEETETVHVHHRGGPTVDGAAVVLTGSAIDGEWSLATVGPDRWAVRTNASLPITADASAMVRLEWRPFTGTRIPLAVAMVDVPEENRTWV